MKAAIYTRVSTQEQAEEGFSLDAQLHRLNAYCDSQGWTVADIYTDEGISAKNTERPQLQRMLDDIRNRKVDVVLVYKLDRLTRSVHDLYELLNIFDEFDVGFKSATEVFDTTTAMGRLFITIVGALAQWERETIGERVHFGQAQMVREGRYFGHTPPYGYNLRDGQLFVHSTESQVIRIIFDRYVHGDGVSRLVKYLNDPMNSIPRPRGTDEWSMKVVNNILKNPVYCGYVRYGNKTQGKHGKELVVAKSDHEPIISEETFNDVQRIMKNRTLASGRSGTGVHPLVGVLKCGLCGGSMVGRTERAGRSGRVTDYHGYMCNARRHKRTCTMKMWKSEVVEVSVINELVRVADEMLNKTTIESPNKGTNDESTKIDAELNALKARRKKWTDAFNKDHITSEMLGEQLRDIAKEESILRERLESLSQTSYAVTAEMLHNFTRSWDVASPQERRELIRDIAETIWVYPDGHVRIDLCGGL